MKNSTIKITNSRRGPVTIDIEGMIGVPEEWQFDEPAQRVSTYEKFQKTVAAIGKIRGPEVIVNIRSTGGDVADALMIYDALTGLDARITTRCRGYVASAATIIAQAASPGGRELSANALYLIHNSTANCEGTTDELRQSSELLKKTDARIAAIYAEKSGHEVEEFAVLMAENAGNGRWLTPDETIERGLADRLCVATTFPENAADEKEALVWEQQREIDRLNREMEKMQSELDQNWAVPTITKQKEDPSPTAESRRSTNYSAYEKDVEGFLK